MQLGSSRHWRSALFVVPLSCCVGAAVAQDRSGFRPGRVEELYPKERVWRDDAGLYLLPFVAGDAVPADADQFHFTLREVRIDGATTYDVAVLRPLFAGRLGKRIAVGEVYRIADAIAQKYRDDGHARTEVLVPGQRILDGVVAMTVEEGR